MLCMYHEERGVRGSGLVFLWPRLPSLFSCNQNFNFNLLYCGYVIEDQHFFLINLNFIFSIMSTFLFIFYHAMKMQIFLCLIVDFGVCVVGSEIFIFINSGKYDLNVYYFIQTIKTLCNIFREIYLSLLLNYPIRVLKKKPIQLERQMSFFWQCREMVFSYSCVERYFYFFVAAGV